MKAELLYHAHAELGEGPVWFEGALWWVDIQAGTLNRLDVATGVNTSRAVQEMLGAAAPTKTKDEWILARRDGFAKLNWATGQITPIGNPEQDRPSNRFNDGKCDPQGRFWAGTLHFSGKLEQAGLYVLTPAMEMRLVCAPVSLSNGIAWSKDSSTMYFVDTIPHHLHAFDFDAETGQISNGRILLQVPETIGHPDGMCIDENDNLWLALWSGFAVVCLDGKTGEILEKIETEAGQTSSCCFGGENYDELYITSAWQNMSLQQRLSEPHAGCIFKAKPGVRGLPTRCFG